MLRGSHSQNFNGEGGREKRSVAAVVSVSLTALHHPFNESSTFPYTTSTVIRPSVRPSACYIWMFSQAFFGECLRAREFPLLLQGIILGFIEKDEKETVLDCYPV